MTDTATDLRDGNSNENRRLGFIRIDSNILEIVVKKLTETESRVCTVNGATYFLDYDGKGYITLYVKGNFADRKIAGRVALPDEIYNRLADKYRIHEG